MREDSDNELSDATDMCARDILWWRDNSGVWAITNAVDNDKCLRESLGVLGFDVNL